jgi:hypothetical protein
MTPCSFIEVSWRFGGAYFLHIHSRPIGQEGSKKIAPNRVTFSIFLFGFPFVPEDGGTMLPRNVSELLVDYMAVLLIVATVRTSNPT